MANNNEKNAPKAKSGGVAERLQPFYISPKATAIAGELLWRVELDGRRFYRRANAEAFLSVTSFTGVILPTNRWLDYWRNQRAIELGSIELVEQMVQEYADYGTLFHEATGNAAKEGGVVWEKLTEWATARLAAIGLGNSLDTAVKDFRRDFAAILEFFYDYRVEVLAVEVPVYAAVGEIAPTLFKPARANAKNPAPPLREGLGTCLDFVVEMDTEKYKPKVLPKDRQRCRAIINLKSGRKSGTSEAHTFQLIAERALFNARFGATFGQIERIFNLSPKAWRGKTPTYTLAEHTDKAAAGLEEQFFYFLKLAQMRGALAPPVFAGDEFTGATVFGQSAADNIKPLPFDNLFKETQQQKA